MFSHIIIYYIRTKKRYKIAATDEGYIGTTTAYV